MSYEYVRQMYQVDPVPGHRVRHQVTGRTGTIARESFGSQHYVRVLFDGDKEPLNSHPTEIDYLGDDGGVYAIARAQYHAVMAQTNCPACGAAFVCRESGRSLSSVEYDCSAVISLVHGGTITAQVVCPKPSYLAVNMMDHEARAAALKALVSL